MTTTSQRRGSESPGLPMPCNHPPNRILYWEAIDVIPAATGWTEARVPVVVCCQCHEVLTGGWDPDAHTDTGEKETDHPCRRREQQTLHPCNNSRAKYRGIMAMQTKASCRYRGVVTIQGRGHSETRNAMVFDRCLHRGSDVHQRKTPMRRSRVHIRQPHAPNVQRRDQNRRVPVGAHRTRSGVRHRHLRLDIRQDDYPHGATGVGSMSRQTQGDGGGGCSSTEVERTATKARGMSAD